MKKIIFSCIVFAVILLACQKDTHRQPIQELKGKFQWIKSVGGSSGNDVLLPPDGEVIVLHLLDGKRFERRKNGVVVSSGQYEQKSVTSVFTNKPEDAILFNDNSGVVWMIRPVSIASGEPSITFQENCTDCYEHYYKVISQ